MEVNGPLCPQNIVLLPSPQQPLLTLPILHTWCGDHAIAFTAAFSCVCIWGRCDIAAFHTHN